MYTCTHLFLLWNILLYMFFIHRNIFYTYFYLLFFIFSFFPSFSSSSSFPNIVFSVLKNLCHYFFYNAFEIIISKDRKVVSSLIILRTVNKVDLIHFAYMI